MTAAVFEAINRQIAAEFGASFSYLAMAAWCEHHKFIGAGEWLRLQSAEEHLHAMKLFNFLLARNHQARLTALEQPTSDFASIVEVFERALDAGAGREPADRRALRTGVQGKGLRRDGRAAVVHHRAGRRREERARRSSRNSRW